MEDSSDYSLSLVASLILLACFFAVGWLGSVGFQHRDAILAVFVESHLNKYQVMAEEIGPVTYLVMHDGILDQLQTFADADPEILGVEQHKWSSAAKIAFTSASSISIESVGKLAGVNQMVRRNVPMLCH